MRLDRAIALRYPTLSRRKARELIAQRRVLVNERLVAVASRDVSHVDHIAIVHEQPELTILRETEEWIAVDKPTGMPTQPTRDRSTRSLEELLRVRLRTVYLVHRIDTGTSGVVVFARSRETAAWLSDLFAKREVRKIYLARVTSALGHEIRIDAPIEGKSAVSIVRPRENGVVEIEILTGRTHQIRVHLARIGHPIAGDRRYGGAVSSRLMLHAWKLEHPRLGELTAPIPAELASL